MLLALTSLAKLTLQKQGRPLKHIGRKKSQSTRRMSLLQNILLELRIPIDSAQSTKSPTYCGSVGLSVRNP